MAAETELLTLENKTFSHYLTSFKNPLLLHKWTLVYCMVLITFKAALALTVVSLHVHILYQCPHRQMVMSTLLV